MTSPSERAADLRRQADEIERQVVADWEQAREAYTCDRNLTTKAAYRDAVRELAALRLASRAGRTSMGIVGDLVGEGLEG